MITTTSRSAFRAFFLSVSLIAISSSAAWAQDAAPAPVAPTTQAAAARVDTPESFENLAEKLLPSVVNISTTMKIKTQANTMPPNMPEMPQFPPGSPFEQFFKDFYDQYKNQPQPSEQKASALGSGFIIDAKEGYVVTNNHVIKDADEIKVILHDDTSLDATLVGTDEKTDIALLKVTPPKDKALTAATWGDSDTAKVGSWILAIGNPFGLGGTVTAGIVSARQRDISAGPYDDFIQTDASINRGNSGGPMFNMQGQVIGINTAIFSPTGGSVGIGFAVPSNLTKSVVEQLTKYGKTRRGWLGVRIQEVTKDIADSLGLPSSSGALISGVTKDGPAAKAGIETGDVILTVNGQKIDHMRKLPRLVAESEVGKDVILGIMRKKHPMDVKVTLGQLETAEETGLLGDTKKAKGEEGKSVTPTATDIKPLGLSLAPVNDQLRTLFKLDKDAKGIVITDVTKDSDAAQRGLAPGDFILEIDQDSVESVADVKTKVDAAQKSGRTSVLAFIMRGDDRRFVPLKLQAEQKK